MNEGEPGGPHLTLILILVVGSLLGFLVAGSISAISTVIRMQKDGMIPDDSRPPAQWLLARARPLLLSLSVAFLISASAAAAALSQSTRFLLGGSSTWLWIGIWAAFYALLLLGSMLTKALALARPLGFLAAVAWLLWPIYVVLRPLTLLLERILVRLVPSVWALDLSPPLSGPEIRDILADDDATALMEKEEVDWARSIFELGDTEIREIMVPRIDMTGMDVDTSFEQAVQYAAAASHTRLPVWEGSQDDILGVLHAKDLLAAQARGAAPSVRELLRPVHFLPESKKIDEALREFRDGRIHLAVVVDEYGGTAGIVTLEDILEEIVGEIRDEFDEEGELVRPIDEQSAVIDPRIDLDDLNELFSLSLPTEESDTLGGLLYSLCGRVPSRGDEVEYQGLRFTIDRVERQRIRQVTMRSKTGFARANGGADTPAETT